MYVWKPLSPSLPHNLTLGVVFGITDIGTVRASNEDNFLVDKELGLVAVADGMGGHEAGEIASAESLTAMADYLRAQTVPGAAPVSDFWPTPFDAAAADPGAHWTEAHITAMKTLHAAVEYANERLYRINMENRHAEGGGMGTTLTGFWQALPGGPLFVFHVGDTRLYRLRGGELTQITRDQTMYQHAFELGVRHNLPGRNLLLQALGPSCGIHPELLTHEAVPGDIYLLCSDGVHGATPDPEIAAILATAVPSNLGSACARLIALAKQKGSRDNITVVLMHCL